LPTFVVLIGEMSRHSEHDRVARREGAVEEAAFLVGSPNRVQLLAELYESDRCSRDALRAAVDASRTTVQRNLTALEDRGWVRRSGRQYRLTPCGELVAAEVLSFADATATAKRLRDVLQWLPREEFDFDLRLLADASITQATSSDPYAPVHRQAATMESAERFCGLLPSVSPTALNAAHHRISDGDGEWTFIVAADSLAALESRPASAAPLLDCAGADCVEVYSYAGDVPFYLGVSGQHVQLGVEDDEGVPRGLVETDHDRVRGWADDVVARYRRQASAYDPAG
jgi:predicted transcriptional regulator